MGTLTIVKSICNKSCAMITLDFGKNGVPTRLQIDSGADCCVLPRDEYVRVTGDESLAMLKGHCIEFKYYADGIHSGLTPPG